MYRQTDRQTDTLSRTECRHIQSYVDWMTEIEQVKVCVQCGNEFRERANYGRLLCRMHPDWRSSDALRRLRCCGYRPGDGCLGYSQEVTIRDGLGCLRCDHHADTPVTDNPIAILPTLLVQTEFVRAPMHEQIVALIDGDRIARITAKDTKLVLSMPAPLASAEINVVTCAFQVLAAFVQSSYYDQTRYPCIAAARQRFESNIAPYMAAPGWNTEIDQHPEFDAFATNEEQELTPLDDTTADIAYSATSRSAMHLPATRLAIVRAMRARNDLRTLAAVTVPFYIIKRIAHHPDPDVVRRMKFYTEHEALRIDPALRDDMHATLAERTADMNKRF